MRKREIMIHTFRQTLEVNGYNFDFSFYGLHTVNGKRFFVMAHDNNSNEHIVFHMTKTNGKWMIVDEVPGWITEIEEQLSDMILKNSDTA